MRNGQALMIRLARRGRVDQGCRAHAIVPPDAVVARPRRPLPDSETPKQGAVVTPRARATPASTTTVRVVGGRRQHMNRSSQSRGATIA